MKLGHELAIWCFAFSAGAGLFYLIGPYRKARHLRRLKAEADRRKERYQRPADATTH